MNAKFSFAALAAFVYCQNNALQLFERDVFSKKIPKAFNGYKILQISDLQSKTFFPNQKPLIRLIEKAAPDIIVITGDLLDRRKTSLAHTNSVIALIKSAKRVAPILYVTGNHEGDIDKKVMRDFIRRLKNEGVYCVDNKSVSVKRGKAKIEFMGVSDIRRNKRFFDVLKKMLKRSSADYKILLSHRPELFKAYKKLGFDLAFTGHTHGGQIRIPFVGAFFAPHQGLFPKYTEGVCEEDGFCMAISRGLGNSRFPLRLFNRPELTTIRLYNDEKIN